LTRIVETAVGRLGPTHRAEPTHRADRTIEILGVAGAGKSTLARHLAAAPGFEMAPFIHARRPADLVLILRTIPRLLSILWAGLTRAPRISWPECKLLVYVTRWAPVLRRRRPQTDTVLLLDQGPLYAIVRLTAEGKPFTERRTFSSWKREMLDRWSTELSDVIWLDAPDAVLWSRINQRDQDHRQKGGQAEAGRRFISRYRRAFESVVPVVEEKGDVRTLRFDTSTSTVAQIIEVVRAAPRREGNQPDG
jgi:adenylate kinase family enzyme